MDGQRILVVDDEPDIARLLEFYLEAEGYSVELLTTGADAVARLDGDPPNLVVLDVMLPHIDGFSILRRLRETPSWYRVPVILLTAKGAEDDQVAGFDAGADDYVVKPFQLDSLVARIQRLLRTGHRSGGEAIEPPA